MTMKIRDDELLLDAIEKACRQKPFTETDSF